MDLALTPMERAGTITYHLKETNMLSLSIDILISGMEYKTLTIRVDKTKKVEPSSHT